jgi:hypothetical protein
MDDWLDRLAEALGERAATGEEIGAMLRLSRKVSHGVERKFAPLSTYVAGFHVQRRVSEGATVAEALQEIRAVSEALIPDGDG